MRARSVFSAALLLALLIPAALCAGQALSLDWQGKLGIVGRLTDFGAGPVMDMRDSVGLSLELSHGLLGGLASYGLSGEVLYMPQAVAAGYQRLSALLPSLETTCFRWETPAPRLSGVWVGTSLGRIDAREPTGLLLNDPTSPHPAQMMDGMEVEMRMGALYAALSGGYLGLLDKRVNRIRFTAADAAELADESLYFAPPRLLAILRVEGSSLVWGQSAGLFGILQKDFRPSADTFDSWYIGAVVSGPLYAGFSHETSLTVSIGVPSTAPVETGILVSSEVSYGMSGIFHEAWLSVRWASSRDAGLAAFPQLAGAPASRAYAEPLSRIIRMEMGIDAALPAPPTGGSLQPCLTARVLLAPGNALPAAYSFVFLGGYLGTEVEASLRYQPMPGLGLRVFTGTLVTMSGALPFLRVEAEVLL